MRAYFDTNIFASIESRGFSKEKIINTVDSQIKIIPFSASHIQEVDNITGRNFLEQNSFISKRLRTIKVVTNCNYIYHEIPSRNIYWLKEEPQTVLKTIRSHPSAKIAIKRFTNLFSETEKANYRNFLGMDLITINNYTPEEAIEHFNSKLEVHGTKENLLQMVEKSISFHADGKTMDLHNRIAAMMEIIDWIGYWKDEATPKSNYARFWDASHAFFASLCDYFITDDRKTRKKTRVIYKLYDIKTKVLSSNGEE